MSCKCSRMRSNCDMIIFDNYACPQFSIRRDRFHVKRHGDHQPGASIHSVFQSRFSHCHVWSPNGIYSENGWFPVNLPWKNPLIQGMLMLKFGGKCMGIQPARTGIEMAIYPLRIDKFIYPPHEQTTPNCCNKPHIIDEEKKEKEKRMEECNTKQQTHRAEMGFLDLRGDFYCDWGERHSQGYPLWACKTIVFLQQVGRTWSFRGL